MRIVIDMQGAQTGSRYRGIGRYTMAFAQAVVRNRGEQEIILALSGLFPETIEPIRAAFDGLVPQKNIRVWNARGPVREMHNGNTWRQNTARLLRESYLESLAPDVVLVTTMVEGYGDDFIGSIGQLDTTTPTALVFYDLIPYLYPDVYLADAHVARWYKKRLEQCKNAALFLSISESTKRELIEYLSIDPDKVVNISAGSDDRFFVEEVPQERRDELLSRFGLTKPYLMYLSATDWRKNHKRLIEAYSKLPETLRAEHQICFVGGLPLDHKEEFKRHAKSCGLAHDDLVITDYVTDEEINILFNSCKAFVFPSWHEGFGLPALEAMQCGRAVIGANTSSLPEVIGMSEALFDPFNVDDMCQRLERVLADDVFRNRLEEHGLRQAKKFSWDSTARIAINAIESLGRSRNRFTLAENAAASNERADRLIERIAALSASCDDKDLIETASCIARNQYNASKVQLLVDISELVQKDAKTGIQRVVRSVLRQWLLNSPPGISVEPVYATLDHGYKYARSFVKIFMGRKEQQGSDEYIDFGPGDVFVGLDLVHPDIAEKHKEFYRLLRNHGVLVKFVLYDLLPLQFPHYCNTGVPEGFMRWLSIVIQSDGMVCISKTVANDLKRYVVQNDCKFIRPFSIEWFHLGAELDGSESEETIPQGGETVFATIRQSISFLMAGTIEPRKGHAQVLDAFELLWQSGCDANLVIVGKQGWLDEQLVERLRMHPKQNKRLFWLEGISDEYLEEIYAASTCLIAASHGEGFGLPLIEAAQHRLPIIARDIPVFREVAGEHAYYFASRDSQGLARSIEEWLHLYEKREHPISDNMPWLTWKESAETLQRILMDSNNQSNQAQDKHLRMEEQ